MAQAVTPKWQLTPQLVSDLSRTIVSEGLDGQRFSMLVSSPSERTEPDEVMFNGMFESVDTLGVKYAIVLRRQALPGRRIIAIDLPAHGYSTKLTGAQHHEIKSSGTLRAVTASQFEALMRAFPDLVDVQLEGKSSGALSAAHFATLALEREVTVRRLFGLDSAGLVKRTSLKMTRDYYHGVFLGRGAYARGEDNRQLNRGIKDFRQELQTNGGKIGGWKMHQVFRVDPSILSYVFENSPLATDHGFEVLQKALELNQDMHVHQVVAGKSGITRWQNISKRAVALASQYPNRLHWHLWPHDNHQIGTGSQAPRFTKFIVDYS